KKLVLGQPPVIDPIATETLATYSWPGNIRELRNVLERALILSGKGTIKAKHLSDLKRLSRMKHPDLANDKTPGTKPLVIRDALNSYQKNLVVEALAKSGCNVTQAAISLGMTRDALKHLMKKLNLKRTDVSIILD
ncbi:MAG: hypothetical protein PHS86_13165, partial [Syntrophaceae bacterium]|nr:hypothetical protein [Syntrophaceae bacterium]